MSGVTPFPGLALQAPDAPMARTPDARVAADFGASLATAQASLGEASPTQPAAASTTPSDTQRLTAAQAAALRALVVRGAMQLPTSAPGANAPEGGGSTVDVRPASGDVGRGAAPVLATPAAGPTEAIVAIEPAPVEPSVPAALLPDIASAGGSGVESPVVAAPMPLPPSQVARAAPAAPAPAPAPGHAATSPNMQSAPSEVPDDATAGESGDHGEATETLLPQAPQNLPATPVVAQAPVPPPAMIGGDAPDGDGGETVDASAAASTPVKDKPAADQPRNVMRNDLALLQPEFRQRLERVIDRMERQYGHSVRVLETHRSPERQAALFAQGRTTEGPVVTWTRNSRHTRGQAADLLIDGRWDNPQGYAHLAEAAAAEGLRTLGARDPGHVELVTGEPDGSDAGAALAEAFAGAREITGTSQPAVATAPDAIARVADVAQVARVARVAEVARVAMPGAPSERSESPVPAAPVDAVPAVTSVSATAPASAAGLTDRVTATLPFTAASAERIAQLLDLQATTAARPLHSMMLRMDAGAGLEDRIRVDLRGMAVDAQLGLGDAGQAALASDRVNELRAALERHGLTTDTVRVQASTGVRAADSVEFSRAAVATTVLELAGARAGAESQSGGSAREQQRQQEQQAFAQQRESHRSPTRPSSEDPRQRARRDAQERQP